MGDFHPGVYKIVAGLAAWFVLAAWIFAGRGNTDFLLTVVSGFVLVAVGIPILLGLTERANRSRDERRDDGRQNKGAQFGDWASREVDILTGPVKGIVAAVETALPIAAVAVG